MSIRWGLPVWLGSTITLEKINQLAYLRLSSKISHIDLHLLVAPHKNAESNQILKLQYNLYSCK